ncbi:MAG: PAS domain-containing protein, partial [bacterium]
AAFVEDPARLTRLQTFKGWFFVSSTAVLLYLLTRHYCIRQKKTESELQSALLKAEEERIKSESIIAAIGDGVSIHDTGFKIIYQNQIHKNLVGDHESEYCFRVFEQRDDVCDNCPVAMVFRDGKVHTAEKSSNLGTIPLTVEITASPLRDASGEIIAAIEVVHDITERRRTEEADRERQRRFLALSQEFNALLDAIPDNLTLQSRDLKVIWANQGAAKGLGKEVPDLIGRYCHALWHNRTSPCSPCPVQRSFQSGKPEYDVIQSSDDRIWELRAVPVKDEQGTVTGVVEVGRDITEHRKLEQQLRQAQKMEAIGQLAGGIAHDFNNILTAIIGYASLTQIKMTDDDPLQSNIEQIISSAERAANLTQSLLAFSRKQIINPHPVDLNQIIGMVEKFLLRIIGEDIELKTVLHHEPLMVMADSGQIEQILMNLATNARDAMSEGGALTITTSRGRPDHQFIPGKQGEYALISFTDTGIGMDDKTKEKVFEPFFTTKEVGKGSGLGLSIIYGIVKQHSGHIAIQSEHGKGTVVKIYLPLIKAEHDGTSLSLPAIRMTGTETILLGEDEKEVRMVTKAVLEESGYTVIDASDGEETLSRFREHEKTIDLLILDVVMPKINGKEVYERVKQMRPDLKVLFVSGYTDSIIDKKGILDAGLHFLSKPVSPNDLLKKVREILDNNPRNMQ